MVEIPFDPKSPSSRAVIVGFYPAPIAHAFHRATNANVGSVDLAYAELQSVLLAYLALVALRAAPSSEPVVQATLKQLRSKNAADGLWVQALREASKRIDSEHLVQLLGVCAEAEGSFANSALGRALGEIVTLRNQVVHEKRYDLRDPWQRAVHRALGLLSDLRFQAVLVPSEFKGLRGKLRTYRATAYKGIEVNAHVAIETDLELVPGRAYLWREGFSDVLALHPFVVEVEADGGGPLNELFVLQSLNRPGEFGARSDHEADAEQCAEIVQALEDFSASMDGASAWLKPGRFACPSLSATSGRRLAAGELFAGRYSIVRHLGSGATADVYAARDTRDSAEVALKLMPVELARSQESLARFRREFAVAHELDHPCLVRYLRKGEDLGSHYIVAELAGGWEHGGERAFDLKTYFALVKDAGPSALDEALVRGILGQVAQALAELHARGIVHRDVKPANVFLFEGVGSAGAVTPERAQHVKLGDLGIARQRGDSTLTLTGVPLGTAEYMPPEQSDDDRVAATMDVYAFGVIAYELLAGEPPFRGRTPQETRAKFNTRRKRLLKVAPHVSPSLARFVEKCLSWEPTERYQNGSEVYAALSRVDRELEVRPSTVDIARGQVLGNYRVLELETRIPGANLFHASDDRTGARVRVGILIDEIEDDPQRHEAALKRLAQLQALNQTSLVRVREYGQENNYTWFLLDDVGAPFDPSAATPTEVIEVARAAIAALSGLHAVGLLHGNPAASMRATRDVGASEPRRTSSSALDVPAIEIEAGYGAAEDLGELITWIGAALRATSAGTSRAAAGADRLARKIEALEARRTSAEELRALLAFAHDDLTLTGSNRWWWQGVRVLTAPRRYPRRALAIVAVVVLGVFAYSRYREQGQRQVADQRARYEAFILPIATEIRFSRFPEALKLLEASRPPAETDDRLAAYRVLLPILAKAPANPAPSAIDALGLAIAKPEKAAREFVDGMVRSDPRSVMSWCRRWLERERSPSRPALELGWLLAYCSVQAEFNKSRNSPMGTITREDVVAMADAGSSLARIDLSPRARVHREWIVLLAAKVLTDRDQPVAGPDQWTDATRALRMLGNIRGDGGANVYESECYATHAIGLQELATNSPSTKTVASLRVLASEAAQARGKEEYVSALSRAYGRDVQQNEILEDYALHARKLVDLADRLENLQPR